MALESTSNLIRPGQNGGTGAIDALHIEEYTGVVHGTIDRKSVIKPMIPVRSVRGTSVLQSYAVGEAQLQVLQAGVAAEGSLQPHFGKNTLTVDTVILARNTFPMLDVWQDNKDARTLVGQEHGKKLAKFMDQAFAIQAIKAAQATASKYAGVDGKGHGGGSRVTMANATDRQDPAKLAAYLIDLFVLFANKDIDVQTDDFSILVKPAEFFTLLQNEQLINMNYVTAAGTKVENGFVLKQYGVPILQSNNFPGGETISSHYLSNAANSNAYDGDFTKVIASVFSPTALLAGETIPVTTAVFWDEKLKCWFVDAHTAFGVTVDRADFAGIILAP